ncbi:MAG: hypothetical protein ACREI8_02920 [Myxococcota bacterium]
MDRATQPKRIWYQSFVDPEAQAPYVERLRESGAPASRAGLYAKASPGAIADFLAPDAAIV